MAKHPSTASATPRQSELTAGVLEGLRRQPKELSPVWFYDERGSTLFDRICELPEYYITRTELAIMREYAAEMAQHIGKGSTVIEPGSGTSIKVRLLLDHLEAPAAYVPIDISREHLLEAAKAIERDYPSIRVIPVCADFAQSFALPPSVALAHAHNRVVYFPGSTLGNFDPEPARTLLSRMRQIAGPYGSVLIGIDLQKQSSVMERAYDDSASVTAEFNLNALRHLNRELGTNFDLSAFEHRAVWVPEESRIEMHLVSKRDQTVRLGSEEVRIAKGEFICTEHCHKYTLESFAALAAGAGLRVVKVWTDPDRLFSVQLLRPAH